MLHMPPAVTPACNHQRTTRLKTGHPFSGLLELAGLFLFLGLSETLMGEASAQVFPRWYAAEGTALFDDISEVDEFLEDDDNVHLAADGQDTWVAVWSSRSDLNGVLPWDTWNIVFARSQDCGRTWDGVKPLNSNAFDMLSGSHYDPHAATDRAGVWVAVWWARWVNGHDDGEILFARSEDNGRTWSECAFLNTTAISDNVHDRHPRVATDCLGNWVVVWDCEDAAASAADRDILFARSTDNGLTWSAPANLGSVPGDDALPEEAHPVIATDGVDWVVIWQGAAGPAASVGEDGDLFVARSIDSGATWPGANFLNANAKTDATPDLNPDLATDGLGTWVVVWQADYDGAPGGKEEIRFARSANGGRTWPEEDWVRPDAHGGSGGNAQPRLASDGRGNWLAVWISRNDYGGLLGPDWDVMVARSAPGGSSWLPEAPFNENAATDDQDERSPSIAADGRGRWVVGWSTHRERGFGEVFPSLDVVYSPVTLLFDSSMALNTTASSDTRYDGYPDIAVGGATWIAAWHSHGGTGGVYGADQDLFFARSISGGTEWSAPAALNTTATADTGHDQRVSLATNGEGGWLAAWVSTEPIVPATGIDFDVYCAWSGDDGASWSAPRLVNSNAFSPAEDMSPRIYYAGGTEWLVVWESDDSLGGVIGEDVDLLFARSVNDGLDWSDCQWLNSTAASDLAHDDDGAVALATDLRGNWIAVWHSPVELSFRTGNDLDIFFATSPDNGRTWSATGAMNFNALDELHQDRNPSVVYDNRGAWVAAWESLDDRAGTIGTDLDLLYRCIPVEGGAGGHWGVLNSNAAYDGNHLDTGVRLAANSLGEVAAFWQSSYSFDGLLGMDTDILYSTLNRRGAGDRWRTPVIVHPGARDDNEDEYMLALAVGPDGHWTAAWQGDHSAGSPWGTDMDIMFNHGLNPVPEARLIARPDRLYITEAGAGVAAVSLSRPSDGEVLVEAEWIGGDTDLQLYPGLPSTVTIAGERWFEGNSLGFYAEPDADDLNGEATIRLTAAGFEPALMTLVEIERSETVTAELMDFILLRGWIFLPRDYFYYDLNSDGLIDVADRIYRVNNPGRKPLKANRAAAIVALGSVAGPPGGSVAVPVTVTNAWNAVALNIRVSYAATILTPTGLLPGDLLAPDHVLKWQPPQDGNIVTAMVFPASGQTLFSSGDGVVCFLTFAISKDAVSGQQTEAAFALALTGPPDLPPVGLSDASGQRISLDISGPGVVTVLAGGADPRDVDGDTRVNAVDIQLVINAALGIPVAFPTDINGDTLTNAVDVQLVINGALGLPFRLPAS